ncbi:MAG: type II secretion system protein GspK [Candidatus Omnitrophica bacterium]|nr:type II secretion system protein GspK [Candidatus Omnitrophota bacterium]MDD5737805.1 type II secretion system protein GspK [Candidatus Omnitrophota bacterium]
MRISGRKGVALILVVGVLSLMALIGTTFAVNMLLAGKEAANYSRGVKARYLAEAGIARAVAELKYGPEGAANSAFDTSSEAWYSGYSDGGCTVTVVDCARQINVNNSGNSKLGQLMQDLNAALGSPLTSAECQAVVDNAPYTTKEEIKCRAGISAAKYNSIKEYITLYGYKDPNTFLPDGTTPEERAPVNINTAPEPVLRAVLRGFVSSDAKAQGLAQAIIAARPFTGWQQYDMFIDGYIGLSPSESRDVKDGVNPNRTKPAAYSTEFCFNSGGYYEVASLGTVRNIAGIAVASRRARAVIKIFDIWNETAKDQFAQAWRNDNWASGAGEGDMSNGEMARVNFMDSCPVRSDQDWNGAAVTGYDTIKGSVKAGFWDNFTENIDGNVGGQTDWTNNEWNPRDGIWNTTVIGQYDTETSDNTKLWPTCDLGREASARWMWANHSAQVYIDDKVRVYDMRMRFWWDAAEPIDYEYPITNPASYAFRFQNDVGRIVFKRTSAGDASYYLEDMQQGAAYGVDPGPLPHTGMLHIWASPSWANYSEPYVLRKTLRIVCQNRAYWAYYNASSGRIQEGNYIFSNINGAGTSAAGLVRLYGEYHLPAFDNVRVIPQDGYYVSVPKSAGAVVAWGSVAGTVTVPSTANAASERIDLFTSVDGGNTWQAVGANGGITSPAASSIQYRANFVSNDNSLAATKPWYSETAVLEDITVSFMPRAQVVYWQ